MSAVAPRRRLAAVWVGSLVALAIVALGISIPPLVDLHGSALIVAIFALPAMVAARAYPLRVPSLARLNLPTALAFGLILLDGGEVAAWAAVVACVVAALLPNAMRRGRADTIVAAARLVIASSVAGVVFRTIGAHGPLFDSGAAAAATLCAALAFVTIDAAIRFVVDAGVLGYRGDSFRRDAARPWQFVGHYAAALAFGMVLAGLYEYVPFIMPLLIFPLSILYLVLKSTVSAQIDTRHAFETLADEVDRRSPETAGHSRRVALFTERCAAAMPGLSPWERQLVVWSARIHDIGNKYVAPSLADRAGPLSDWERDEVQRHALYGAGLLASTAGFRSAAKIIRHHHENLDGSGYPDHLRGRQIPVGSRIIRVAESLDAMLSNRAYRPAFSFEAAAEELRERAGTVFDPVVVEAMLSRLTPSDVAVVAQSLVADVGAQTGEKSPRSPHSLPSASSVTLG